MDYSMYNFFGLHPALALNTRGTNAPLRYGGRSLSFLTSDPTTHATLVPSAGRGSFTIIWTDH